MPPDIVTRAVVLVVVTVLPGNVGVPAAIQAAIFSRRPIDSSPHSRYRGYASSFLLWLRRAAAPGSAPNV
jgi:hypothetical protein